MFVTSSDWKCVGGARKCAMLFHTVGHYFNLYMKSLAQKLTEKMRFFVKFTYVSICDLHGHRSSQVMVRNESLYMSSYLCIIVTVGLSGTVTKIQTCNIFVTIFTFLKDVFRPLLF